MVIFSFRHLLQNEYPHFGQLNSLQNRENLEAHPRHDIITSYTIESKTNRFLSLIPVDRRKKNTKQDVDINKNNRQHRGGFLVLRHCLNQNQNIKIKNKEMMKLRRVLKFRVN